MLVSGNLGGVPGSVLVSGNLGGVPGSVLVSGNLAGDPGPNPGLLDGALEEWEVQEGCRVRLCMYRDVYIYICIYVS